MRLVGPRFSDPIDHTVGSAAVFGGVPGALHFELFHALRPDAVHGRVVAALAVGFGAVQLLALAVQQAAANTWVARRPDHSWRQNDECQIASDAAPADE